MHLCGIHGVTKWLAKENTIIFTDAYSSELYSNNDAIWTLKTEKKVKIAVFTLHKSFYSVGHY